MFATFIVDATYCYVRNVHVSEESRRRPAANKARPGWLVTTSDQRFVNLDGLLEL